MKTSLIVGMGIGKLYEQVLNELSYGIITVDLDPTKSADFLSVEDAIAECRLFDTAHICTPNFTHLDIARKLAPVTGIIFVEKPGVSTASEWEQLINDFPNTRFMMVKNNQYRNEIKHFKELADQSDKVYLRWNNVNRIPYPGSWFTTKEKAFGGVSRDLLPHLLSYYCTLTDYKQGTKIKATAKQSFTLDEIDSTDYGTVNKDGTYDVDDFCYLEFTNDNTTWILSASWKVAVPKDDSSIAFSSATSAVRHELGLCPEGAYKKMIETAVENKFNDEFWQKQFEQDMWIHQQMEELCVQES